MKEFTAALKHHSSQQVTDQMLIDRLFALDIRLVEIKNVALRFMSAQKNKQLLSYINKSKNPNRRGSGGTQFFNPVRQSRELALVYAVLSNQVKAIKRSLDEQFEEGSAMTQGNRMMLLACLLAWENFGSMDFVQKKKIRAIDLINVVYFEMDGDWTTKTCGVCRSVYPEYEEGIYSCLVCSSTAKRLSAERSSRKQYA